MQLRIPIGLLQPCTTNNSDCASDAKDTTTIESSKIVTVLVNAMELSRRVRNLGQFHAVPDELLVDLIFTFFNPRDLITLQQCSPVMHVLCNESSIWLSLWCQKNAINSDQVCCKGCRKANCRKNDNVPQSLLFHGSWKAVVLGIQPDHLPIFSVFRNDFSSDFLYARWQRSHCDVSNFVPAHELEQSGKQISRIDVDNVCTQEFRSKYDLGSLPVVLRETCTASWPARTLWQRDQLLNLLPTDVRFDLSHNSDVSAGKDLYLSMQEYLMYCHYQHDEVPLYVFDEHFDEKFPEFSKHYNVDSLKYFDQDFSPLLLESSKRRFKWLVVGPARTGAPWHVDPKQSSAWNALITGRKRWAMYPPSVTPPGLDLSPTVQLDHDAFTSLRWFAEVLPTLSEEEKPFEIIQEPGEVVYIPHGWWHMVLNLDFTVSVTHNIVNQYNIRDCLSETLRDHGPVALHKIKERLRLPLQSPKVQKEHRLIRRHIDLLLLPTKYGYVQDIEFITSFKDPDIWKLYVAKSLKHHQLKNWVESVEQIETLTSGMNPVFKAGKYFVKFFSPYRTDDVRQISWHKANVFQASHRSQEHMSEFCLLRDLSHCKELMEFVKTPKPIATGYLSCPRTSSWPWPYIVTSSLKGKPLRQHQSCVALEEQDECELNNSFERNCKLSARDVMDVTPRNALTFLQPSLERQRLAKEIGQALLHFHSVRLLPNSLKHLRNLNSRCCKGCDDGIQAVANSTVYDEPCTFAVPLPVDESSDSLQERDWHLYAHYLEHQREYRLSCHWQTSCFFGRCRENEADQGFQTSLMQQANSFVPANIEELLPIGLPVLLHGDLQIGNILTLNSKPSPRRQTQATIGFVDFEDCLVGDPCYDLVALFVSAFRCQKQMLRECLLGYWAEATKSQVTKNGLVWQIGKCKEGDEAVQKQFLIRMMCLTLLHPCEALKCILRHCPEVSLCSTWLEVAELVWKWW